MLGLAWKRIAGLAALSRISPPRFKDCYPVARAQMPFAYRTCMNRSPRLRNAPPIADLLRVPSRFLRSVQLDRDFHDVAALKQYVVTPPMAEAFRRITDGLRPASGRRAWRITGDYGVGKSSFALVLAHLLYSRSHRAVARIAGEIGWSFK